MAEVHATPIQTAKACVRIPDGTRVWLREVRQKGVVDGLTELIVGPGRNLDGRTQYRLNFSIRRVCLWQRMSCWC